MKNLNLGPILCIIFGLLFWWAMAMTGAYYGHECLELSFTLTDNTFEDTGSTIGDLLDAIEWVESRGNAGAVCPDGCCVGAYQLTKGCVDDVNKRWGTEQFTYKDRLDKKISRGIAWTYMLQYVPLAYDTLESRARIFKKGPDGWRNDPRWFVRNRGYTLEDAVTKISNSIAYWDKVKARMEAER